MSILLKVIVTFFAGMGAGLGTGFAGMSAAAVISPMLITFLGMDPYMAVQDVSSMLVAEVADPKKGDYVIDVCAAPGGKSQYFKQGILRTSGSD